MARYKICPKSGKTLTLDETTGEWMLDRSRSSRFDPKRPVRLTVFSDIQEFVSVAGDKPELITSRSQLARHERSNNMRQVGNDLKGKVVEKAKRRAQADKDFIAKNARLVRVSTKWV